MKQKFIITYASVPGAGKTPITNNLSSHFRLPVFNNDQLRFEIKEDLMVDDINLPGVLEQYNKKLKEKNDEILSSGMSIILDSSVDRRWSELKADLINHGYAWFLISIDLSEPFIKQLFLSTKRFKAIEELPAYNNQHQEFLSRYSRDVNLHLRDKDFPNRVKICTESIEQFIATST